MHYGRHAIQYSLIAFSDQDAHKANNQISVRSCFLDVAFACSKNFLFTLSKIYETVVYH